MSRYKAYPEYRDSGVVWLGRVPVNWVPKRFKQVVADKKKTFNPSLEAGSISFGRVVFKDSDNLSQETKDSYQEVRSGEYLVNPLNLNYDLLSLRTALSEIDVVVSTGYIVLKSTGVLKPRYIRWLLHELDVSHMKTLGAGVRQTINYSDIGNSYFFAPTEDEQEAISSFLDHETAKIDALIEKQQRLIELLKEKRQAVISHAVTKGLNPNAPMKDSGVEWLGEVPAHWGVLKLGYLMKLKGGAGFPDSYQGQEGHEIPFYKVGDLARANSESCLTEPWHTVTHETAKELRATIFSTGSIVFAKVGAALLLKRFCTLKKPSCIDNNMMGAELGFIEIREFLLFLMPLLDFELIVNPGAVPSVNGEQITSILIALPPQDEQIEIVDFLKAYRIKFDHLISNAEQAISLFQERRTALISAAVTGKIDVRDWQAAA